MITVTFLYSFWSFPLSSIKVCKGVFLPLGVSLDSLIIVSKSTIQKTFEYSRSERSITSLYCSSMLFLWGSYGSIFIFNCRSLRFNICKYQISVSPSTTNEYVGTTWFLIFLDCLIYSNQWSCRPNLVSPLIYRSYRHCKYLLCFLLLNYQNQLKKTTQ